MIEGLWIVQYEGLQGNGGGVAVFINGKILGGDTGYTYEGKYEVQSKTLTALVHVSNFLPNIPNVLGVVGDFDLQIQAPLRGDVIQGAMSLVGRPGMSVAASRRSRAFDHRLQVRFSVLQLPYQSRLKSGCLYRLVRLDRSRLKILREHGDR